MLQPGPAYTLLSWALLPGRMVAARLAMPPDPQLPPAPALPTSFIIPLAPTSLLGLLYTSQIMLRHTSAHLATSHPTQLVADGKK